MLNVSISASHKYARFGRGATILEARGGEPLDLQTIADRCPSVVAEDKHHSRSDKYTFISTLNILEGLAKEGFEPYSIMQGGTKYDDRRGFTKHFIRLRQRHAIAMRSGTAYEVCLLGSHDGTTSEQMFGGFFRDLCKNGTIWFDAGAVKITIPHKGDVIDQVIEGAYTVVGQSQLAYDSLDNLRRIELNRDEQMAFASAACVARFEDDKPPVTPAQLLAPRRLGDTGNDLWTTFNRVQENVIRGGLSYVQETVLTSGDVRRSNRVTRPVRSVDGDVRLNRALWTLADEMAKIKASAV